jgi:hypothetical protein
VETRVVQTMDQNGLNDLIVYQKNQPKGNNEKNN